MNGFKVGLVAATAFGVLGVAGGAVAGPPTTDPVSTAADAFIAHPDLNPASAAAETAICDAYLAEVARRQTALEGRTGPATAEEDFRSFDALMNVMIAAANDAGLIMQTNVDASVRDAAQACSQKVSDANTAISLSRPIYDRLGAIDPASVDAPVRYILARTLKQYELAGVAGDAATRARVGELQNQITAAGLTFNRNITDSRLIVTAPPEELDGLPADFIANHAPGADGLVRISTDYPDVSPVLSYAKSERLRRALMEAFLNRAWPENEAVLSEMLARRADLARTLNRPSFAHVATEDKMIGSPENAEAFLERAAAAADAPARRDYARLLARLQQIDPTATEVPAWSRGFIAKLIEKEAYQLDAQEVRQYFAYDNVRDGIFRLTEDLFGVQIRPWDTPVWHDSVEAYEMLEDGQVIGRFYLDAHPREGKYNHAAQFDIRTGIEGRAIPVASLVTNFPAGDHSTGLMEHGDVETFLHEFGHLLHAIFSGHENDWAMQTNGAMEWDFIEAPSQMLENWVWDYDTLSRFAVNAEGQTIPRDLVERMNRARGFGEALGDRGQLGYAAVSLDFHAATPPSDLDAAFRAAEGRYAIGPSPAGTHQQDSFGHLAGYSAIYYTYMWSKTISTDLFTAFEANGLRDPETARRYRETVLAPGSSKPAAQLIEDFLGRPLSFDAYQARLNRQE